MPTFGRLLTAMVTPMKSDLSVDYERAVALAHHLADNGSDGVIVSGTTGESPTLTVGEKLKLFELITSAVGDRIAVIGGTSSYSTAEAIDLSQKAGRTGIHGLLLVTPYYNKPPQEGLYQHFKAIAESTDLPCILYNVPARTSINISAATTLRLAQLPNVVGIKECADLAQVTEILAGAPADFLVWSGDDGATLPYLAVGAYGIVSVAAHIVGPHMRAMIQSYLSGQVAEAARWHQTLSPVYKGLFAVTNPVLVKAALDLTGFPVGPVRLPLVDATQEERAALANVLTIVAKSHPNVAR